MGGLGVVIFVVVILLMFNIGGMKLFKVEMSGLIKDDKLFFCIFSFVYYFFIVYMVLIFICVVGYFLVGMDLFDVLGYSFLMVFIGGFLIYDVSIGYFKSDVVLWVVNLFMLLGVISFVVYFCVMFGCSLKIYWCDEEFCVFLLMVLFIFLLIILELLEVGIYYYFWDVF